MQPAIYAQTDGTSEEERRENAPGKEPSEGGDEQVEAPGAEKADEKDQGESGSR